MPLSEVPLAVPPADPPADVAAFLAEAGRRIDDFHLRSPTTGFVASDYPGAWRLLRALADGPLVAGNRFCEWGSGLGVVAGLAAGLGFDASGIESEPELVAAARDLAADFGLAARFAHGSFVPPGGERYVKVSAVLDWLTVGLPPGYPDLDLAVDDFDVIYVYPWPAEQYVTADLFERYAAAGAVLVSFHGPDGFRVRRKVADRRHRRR